MSKMNDGGPAFPHPGAKIDRDIRLLPQAGMSLRDYVAASALPALMAELYQSCRERREKVENIYLAASMAAFECADAFIKARSLSKEGGEE